MNYIITHRARYDAHGGMENYAKAYCDAIRTKAERVTFITLDKRRKYINGVLEEERNYWLKPSSVILATILVNFRALLVLRVTCHVAFGHSGYISLLFRKNKVDVHYLGFEFLFNNRKRTGFRGIVKRCEILLFLWASKRARHLVCLTRKQKEILSRSFSISNERLFVLSNFVRSVQAETTNYSATSEEYIISNVGRDCDSKRRWSILNWAVEVSEKMQGIGSLRWVFVSNNFRDEEIKVLNRLKEIAYCEYRTGCSNSDLDAHRRRADFEVSFSNQQVPVLSLLEGAYAGAIPIVDNDHGGCFARGSGVLFSDELVSFLKGESDFSRKDWLYLCGQYSFERFKFKICNELHGS